MIFIVFCKSETIPKVFMNNEKQVSPPHYFQIMIPFIKNSNEFML